MTITKMMITKMPMIVPMRPLFMVSSFASGTGPVNLAQTALCDRRNAPESCPQSTFDREARGGPPPGRARRTGSQPISSVSTR